jgi:enediyne biosynthesis protein E4
MYVAGYIKKELVEGQNIFNKEGYGRTSLMLLNNGDNTFIDITESSGLYYKHNTFMGMFVDVDNDGLEDLVVVHDTGQVRTWKNFGNAKFKNIPNPSSKQYSYPMGIAVTDYKNDGMVDFFFSNVGSTVPSFFVKGDLRADQLFNPKWILFQNKGNFEFDDVAAQAKLADYEFS